MKYSTKYALTGLSMCAIASLLMGFGFLYTALSRDSQPEKIFRTEVVCGELMGYEYDGHGGCINYRNAAPECRRYHAIIRMNSKVGVIRLDDADLYGPTPLVGDRVCLVVEGAERKFSLEEQME